MFLRIRLIFIFILLILFTIGCGPSKIERLENQVFFLHDEVMPEMDQLKSLRRQLISKAHQSPIDSIRCLNTAHSLNGADSLMWAWMYQYIPVSKLRDSLSTQEIEEYLGVQHKFIQTVNDSMKVSMKKASLLLEH